MHERSVPVGENFKELHGELTGTSVEDPIIRQMIDR